MDGREWFSLASEGFVEVARGIDEGALRAPGLGEWDVRALLGHTTRAFLTVETYLAQGSPHEQPTLDSPAGYYRAAAAGRADPAQVARRGREAGDHLGSDPVANALAIVDRVTALVAATPGDTRAATPVGVLRLGDYLPTRAFELTVHGIDLVRATGQAVPQPLRESVPAALHLAVDLAGEDPGLAVLLALTGREPLPSGFSVL